jgi:hypothetical protein
VEVLRESSRSIWHHPETTYCLSASHVSVSVTGLVPEPKSKVQVATPDMDEPLHPRHTTRKMWRPSASV